MPQSKPKIQKLDHHGKIQVGFAIGAGAMITSQMLEAISAFEAAELTGAGSGFASQMGEIMSKVPIQDILP